MAEVDDEEGVVLLLQVVLSDGNAAGIYRLDPMWEHAPPQPTGGPVSVAAQDATTSLLELVEPIGEPSLEVAELLVSVTKQGQSVTSLPLFPVLADEDSTKRALSQGDSGFSLIINPTAGHVVARFHQMKGSQRKWISTGVYSLSMMSVEDNMPCISIGQLVGKQIIDFHSQETLDVQFPPLRLNFEKHFRCEKRLGKGTEGVVYECSARFSQHRCAVKKIIPEDLYMKSDREPSDVNIMAMLSHTKIAQLYFAWADVDRQDFGQVLEATYICMEMCATSLMHYLEGKAEVDLDTAYRIFRQLMTGLEYMHQQDVVHRDIKPANVLITKNLGIKIADLGISIRKQPPYILDFHGGMYGSIPYRAPEIINLYVRHDEKVDIFSAGMIYYELFMPGVKQRLHKLKSLSKLIREGMETFDQVGQKFDLDSLLDGTNILSGWKGDYCILKRMLVPNHRERPSACEVLAMLEVFPDAVLTDEDTMNLSINCMVFELRTSCRPLDAVADLGPRPGGPRPGA